MSDTEALFAGRRMSHGEQLARAARAHPDRIAFQFEGTARSYAETDERVSRLARALAARGIGRGDRVAVFMRNRLEVVESYPFRVTRNADVQRNEETAEDLLEVIQEELRERRFATVVRLELAKGMPRWMVELLAAELEVTDQEIFELDASNCTELTLAEWESRPVIARVTEGILAPWRDLG